MTSGMHATGAGNGGLDSPGLRAYDKPHFAETNAGVPILAAGRDRIRENLERVRERMALAADRGGRAADSVRLVAVTKMAGIEDIRSLLELGISDLGENRVESAREKIAVLGRAPRWHMIGNIQRRKIRDVVSLFHRVDAVDRMSLARALETRCSEAEQRVPILLEVNVSGEKAKHGFNAGEVEEALENIRSLRHLEVQGLMTMAPATARAEESRPVFAALRELGGRLGLQTLSMGMSNDFEVAIEEGASEVRIGSALYQ